jgi:hypothetical protein
MRGMTATQLTNSGERTMKKKKKYIEDAKKQILRLMKEQGVEFHSTRERNRLKKVVHQNKQNG